MRFPCISEVRAYWEALRDGRAVPYRSEVDPRGIERALEYAFVLERIAPQVARFRLAGMHLNDLMGMEVRGMPLTAFFTPKARREIAGLLDAVFTGPRTAELTLAAESGLGKPTMAAKLLILPLRSDLGDVSRALGCLAAEGPIGRTPRRFDLVESLVSPIAESLPSRRVPPVPAPTGFAEPAAPFAGAAPQPVRSRGHLRLVVSDE
ncbi:PAS domain-containing protein [Defluviimonas sp. SAOS-178_SWC]|uniref:PAS domain-containing protein n=1 Tax=Defluviimonas sp. SAOS-178_SWC TaxID=3121287 RepID=UPI003221A90D